MKLVIVAGKSGSGKSTLCRKIISDCECERGQPLVVHHVGARLREIAKTDDEIGHLVRNGLPVSDGIICELLSAGLSRQHINVLDNFPQSTESLEMLVKWVKDRFGTHPSIKAIHSRRSVDYGHRSETAEFKDNRNTRFDCETLNLLKLLRSSGCSILETTGYENSTCDFLCDDRWRLYDESVLAEFR